MRPEPYPRTYSEDGKAVQLWGFAIATGTLFSIFFFAALLGHSYGAIAVMVIPISAIGAIVFAGGRVPSTVILSEEGIGAHGVFGPSHFIAWSDIRRAQESISYGNLKKYRVVRLASDTSDNAVHFGDTIAGYDEVVAEIRRRLPQAWHGATEG